MPRALVNAPDEPIVASYLGLGESVVHYRTFSSSHVQVVSADGPHAAKCKRDKSDPREFKDLLTSRHHPAPVHRFHGSLYQTCESVTLLNGDRCTVLDFVLYELDGRPRVGRVVELAQACSERLFSPIPDLILLQAWTLSREFENMYDMPYLVPDLDKVHWLATFQVRLTRYRTTSC